jgi:N-acyl-D-amino-acid deacylase
MRTLRALSVTLYVAVATNLAAAAPTGKALPGLESFDSEITALMNRWAIPGASLAVSRHGKIVLVRGYGLANTERNEPVQPLSQFRLGSLTKMITAVAVLQLVEQGKLALDDKVLPLLGDVGPPAEAIRDPRMRDITVRMLLQHAGGWDRDKSGDPIGMPYIASVASRQGGPLPPTCVAILRDSLEQRLDFDPGTRFAYSNVGYCILGRIVERAGGMPFDAYVRAHVLEPAGAGRMRLGQTRVLADGEVTYYDYPGAPPVEAAPGFGVHLVAAPYGALPLEPMDAYGSRIGAAVDYLKFMLAIDGQRSPALLTAASVREMRRRPAHAAGPTFYGLGTMVRPVDGGDNWWHGGSQPGMEAFAVRTAGGFGWVAAFNMRPKDRNGFVGDLDKTLWRAALAVSRWPDGDLFDEFR